MCPPGHCHSHMCNKLVAGQARREAAQAEGADPLGAVVRGMGGGMMQGMGGGVVQGMAGGMCRAACPDPQIAVGSGGHQPRQSGHRFGRMTGGGSGYWRGQGACGDGGACRQGKGQSVGGAGRGRDCGRGAGWGGSPAL